MPAPNHPSDFHLDQLFLDELNDELKSSVQEHIASCLSCRKRQRLRDDGLAAFPEVNAESLLKRVHNASEEASELEPAKRGSFWRVVPVLVAAAALLLFVRLRNPSGPASHDSLALDGVRAKGGLTLRVFRGGTGAGEEVLSGNDFAMDDTIRFVVDLQQGADLLDLHVILLSVEEEGNATSIYFPSEGDVSSSLVLDEEGALPVAIRLDEYEGQESLHLIVCPRAFYSSSLHFDKDSSGISSPTSLPDGCLHSRYMMTKTRK